MLRLTTQIAAIVMATLFVYFFPKEINIVSEEVCWKESLLIYGTRPIPISTKVWKRLGGQDGGANVNKTFIKSTTTPFCVLCFLTVVKFHTSAENL